MKNKKCEEIWLEMNPDILPTPKPVSIFWVVIAWGLFVSALGLGAAMFITVVFSQ